MNIFKRIYYLGKKYRQLIFQRNGDVSLLKKQLGLIKVIIRLKEEKWGISDKSMQYLDIAINEGVEAAAEWKGTTKNAVYKMISVRSSDFEDKIGHSTLSLIEQGKIEEALLSIKTSWGLLTVDDVLSPYLLSIIAKDTERQYVNLKECEKEILFLYNHSKKVMEKQLLSLDEKKLSSVLNLLIADTLTYAGEKHLLYELFNKMLTYSEFKKRLL